MLNDLHTLAHDITYHPKERLEQFRSYTPSQQSAVFELLSAHIQQDILSRFSNDEVITLLDHMDMQQAEHSLTAMKNARRRTHIVHRLKGELKEKVEYFLRFHPKAALTLLNFNYLLLSHDASISHVADAMHAHWKETGRTPEVLAHKDGELVGEVSVDILVREPNSRKIHKYVTPVTVVPYRADIKDIMDAFTSSPHRKVVVLDKDGSVLGIIYADDALDLFQGKSTQTLYQFAGVKGSERPFDTVFEKVSHRYKWLIINLATAFLAASVVSLFKDTLSQLVILAAYMPIVAGMGGNAGTQTLAVIVRGIAVGEIDLKNGLSAIRREASAGFVNGIVVGVIVAIVATLWNGNPMLGLVIGLAMVVNLVVAGFFGALVPLIMKRLGKDPATSATIFITTATDVLGFFCFLGLASLLLL